MEINKHYAVKGFNYQSFAKGDTTNNYPEIFKKDGSLRKGWVLTNAL